MYQNLKGLDCLDRVIIDRKKDVNVVEKRPTLYYFYSLLEATVTLVVKERNCTFFYDLEAGPTCGFSCVYR